EYHTAMAEPLEGHKLANFIRHSAASEVNGALGELGAGLIVEGSAGAGNWAAVPWISVFDPAITTSATRGYECLNPIRARGVLCHHRMHMRIKIAQALIVERIIRKLQPIRVPTLSIFITSFHGNR